MDPYPCTISLHTPRFIKCHHLVNDKNDALLSLGTTYSAAYLEES